jgi:hypothetical protein
MAGTERDHAEVSTVVLWAGGLGVIALAIAAYAVDARDGLQGILSLSGPFWWGFNALDLIFAPLQVGLLMISALSMWAASRWIATPSLRAVLIAVEFAVTVFVLLMVTGFEARQVIFSPVRVLMFLVPLLTTAIYSAIAHRRDVMRVLGAAVLSLAGGVMLYVIGVILVGSQG